MDGSAAAEFEIDHQVLVREAKAINLSFHMFIIVVDVVLALVDELVSHMPDDPVVETHGGAWLTLLELKVTAMLNFAQDTIVALADHVNVPGVAMQELLGAQDCS